MAAPGENLRVNGDRLWDSIHAMAEIGPGVAGGNNRQTLTDSDKQGRELFKRCYGPTVAAYRGLADDPERVAELDHALDTLAARHLQQGSMMQWEYLQVVAERA